MFLTTFLTMRILFLLLIILIIIDTIYCYHSADLENILQRDPRQLRSVLWPKICVNLKRNRMKYQSQKIRKCYPFDMN